MSGYTCGKDWVSGFISAYETRYGVKPPVDAWSIDVYPIDWTNTPNNDATKPAFYRAKGENMIHSDIAIHQLKNMRAYFDAIPEYAATPIWITEIAIHNGYDGWIWDPFPVKLSPVGTYHWTNMSDYLSDILDWLDANADSHQVEKWFFYKSWQDIVDNIAGGYMGITFFEGPQPGDPLNCLGDIYRARSLDTAPVECDANGNTVPAGQ